MGRRRELTKESAIDAIDFVRNYMSQMPVVGDGGDRREVAEHLDRFHAQVEKWREFYPAKGAKNVGGVRKGATGKA